MEERNEDGLLWGQKEGRKNDWVPDDGRHEREEEEEDVQYVWERENGRRWMRKKMEMEGKFVLEIRGKYHQSLLVYSGSESTGDYFTVTNPAKSFTTLENNTWTGGLEKSALDSKV